ncbi:MAG: Uma2 family endonuclease [bacterium]|nr:Uma2 family endonuclease [bacterium]
MMLDVTKMMTVDEYMVFVSLPENDDKYFELNHGEIVEMTPPSALHVRITGIIFAYLFNYAEPQNLGFVFGDNCGYILSKWRLVIPDVSFVAKGRLSEPLPHLLPLAPDLAVEVISPSNTITEMNQKIEDYFKYGTKIVWLVYPEIKTVDVWHQLEDGTLTKHKFEIQDTLSGEDVLPNFTLPVAKIFPQ